jgi:hypothetical protein
MKDYLTMFVEEASKEGHSIVKAGVDILFKANGELAALTVDNYKNNRFNIRLEDFAYEQEQLSDEVKENFYKNITSEQLNYLFELLDKARTSTYDLHAKILAKLYANLLLNGNLNYYESSLLANINFLNDKDLIKVHSELNGKDLDENTDNKFKVDNYQDYLVFNKSVQLGFFEHRKKSPVQLPSSTVSPSPFAPLPGTEMLHSTASSMPKISTTERAVQDKRYRSNEFTKDLFQILDEIIKV